MEAATTLCTEGTAQSLGVLQNSLGVFLILYLEDARDERYKHRNEKATEISSQMFSLKIHSMEWDTTSLRGSVLLTRIKIYFFASINNDHQRIDTKINVDDKI